MQINCPHIYTGSEKKSQAARAHKERVSRCANTFGVTRYLLGRSTCHLTYNLGVLGSFLMHTRVAQIVLFLIAFFLYGSYARFIVVPRDVRENALR